MSVKQYQRKTSEIQFIGTANEITRDVLAIAQKFPKNKRVVLGEKITSLAMDAYDEVLQGDSVYPRKGNKEDVALRREHFQTAYCKFASLEAFIIIACDSVDSFTVEQMYHLGDLINYEKNLVHAVMTSDAKKLNKQLKDSEDKIE